MKKVLFLHSWYSKATDIWYGWLKTELEEQGYSTCFPDLPELRKDVPNMGLILQDIEKLSFIDENTTVIGHSIGCLLAMRLAETHPLKKMILVSGWDFDDLTAGHIYFWKTKINHSAIKSNVKERVVVHSDNDPYITAITAEDMSKRLAAEFILIPRGGHFSSKEKCNQLPQLLSLL
jgi:uncharacterized protein